MKRKNFVFVVFAAMLLAGCGEAAHEHNLNSEWSKDAANHWHTCSGCEEKVDSAAHDFEDVVTAATYDAGGFTTHTCKTCGYSFKDNETAKLTHNFSSDWSKDANGHWHACTDADFESLKDGEAGHTYRDDVTAPTFDAAGYTTHTCTVCGYNYQDTPTNKKTHQFEEGWTKDENKHWHKCTDAGYESLKDGEANHTYTDEVIAPTYEADGYTKHTCICGYTYNDTVTAKLVPTQLAAPVVSYDTTKGKIVWDEVANAGSYKVLDGADVVAASTTDREFAISNEVGEHSITVVALTNAAAYSDSVASNAYAYETIAVALSDVAVDAAGNLTIGGVAGKVTINVVGSDAVVADLGINANSYKFTTSNNWEVKANPIYDATNKVNYAGTAATKTVRTIFNAVDPRVLEDGSAEVDADLADKYVVEEYQTDKWASVSKTVNLSEMNGEMSDGKCVKLNFRNSNQWHRYTAPIEGGVLDGYEGLCFLVKPSDGATSFGITLNTPDGSYASYTINALPECWAYYEISFNDSAWNVNGTGYSIAQAASATGASVKQFIAGVSSYAFRAKHAADGNWTSNAMYLDDFMLLPTCSESSHEIYIEPYDEYIFDGGETFIDIKINETTADLSATGWGAISSLEFEYSFDDNMMTFTNTNLTIVCSVSANGKVLTVTESTGAYASAAPVGTEFRAGALLDNFESYTETGVGLDNSHTDPNAVSGLRAGYYCDYYTGKNGTSPVGGTNWSLMGSTDYIQFSADKGRGPSKALIHKINTNSLRMMSGDLARGTAESKGIGSKICFWVKQSTNQKFTVAVRSFYMSQVTASNQNDSNLTKGEDVSVAAGSDWVKVECNLLAKNFYGFALTFKNGGSSAVFVPVDNIYILR